MANGRIAPIAALLSAALWLAACGGGGGDGGGAPNPVNRAPAFTSPPSATVAENASGAFYTAAASDPDGDALTFSIAGGADAARFQIQPTSGALSFATAPNFEFPGDADADNVYLVRLAVFDGAVSAALDLTVTVTNVPGPVGARRIAQGFSQPLFVAGRGDGSGRLLVVQKGGLVRIVDPRAGAIAGAPFLDVSTQISTSGERGLLGLALAPNFAASQTIYVFLTDPSGTIELRRYSVSGDAAVAASADVILTIPHPGADNHNGGWIGFGPDGLLYIGVGDGGGSGDPNGNAQNPNILLGKILRIDPGADAFPGDANRDYAIPSGNPFANGGGAPEIWLTGLRNPFRASFDAANLFIGDVGQDAMEEIDLARATDSGANYGWNILEGTQVFAGGSTAGLTPPIAEYPHGPASDPRAGNSVTGGYVYRGPLTILQGEYIFGDFINRAIFSFPASAATQGVTLPNTQFTVRTTEWAPAGAAIGNIASFGEDDRRNLYIVDFDGEIFVLDEID